MVSVLVGRVIGNVSCSVVSVLVDRVVGNVSGSVVGIAFSMAVCRDPI